MMYASCWKKLMCAASLALLPACGMEDPSSPEAQEAAPRPPTQLEQARAELDLGTETTELPARGDYGGGAGGVSGTVTCPINHVAVGIHGTFDRDITSLGLVCQALNADGTLGAVFFTAAAGDGGGTDFISQCKPGMAVVGFPGHSSDYVNSLGLHCAVPNTWVTSDQVQASVAEMGSTSGNPFSDVCPQQYVVTQINVRTGAYLNQEQATCTFMRAPPASCQDIKTANPSAGNGAYVLYVNRDASKPWTAWCHNMAGTPAEYLSLPSTGPSVNFSQYTAGINNGGGTGTNVRTLFTKIRIDPATLIVNTGDQTFSTSSGLLWHGQDVTSMSYAAAMNCTLGDPGLGNVDLRGTPFAVAPNEFVAMGYRATGGATYRTDNRVVDLWNRGSCGWMSVREANHPFNGRSASLHLQYSTAPARPSSGSFSYSVSNTNDATQNTKAFDVMISAGQKIQLGTCSVNGASGTGDTYLRLYAPNGAQVAANDDACGLLSFVSFTAPQAGTYRIQAGCFSNSSCNGTVAYTIQ